MNEYKPACAKCGKRGDCSAPPVASDFRVGEMLITVKDISPRIPAGTRGIVNEVDNEVGLITIEWSIPGWPFVKITTGTPTNGYKKVE